MRRITRERQDRPSYLMDYGPDWPPVPGAVVKESLKARRRYRLWQKALARIVIVTVIWAAGAIVLHLLLPTGNTMDFPAPPAQGHTTDVTSSLPPHPATTGSHP
jgi:hypothetical protein